MEIYLHNTLGGKKDKFEPLSPGAVSIYSCGPTVYHYAHIGNLRSYVFADTLRRMFEWNGYTVQHVINITDVGHLVSDADDGEDKMEKGARREGKTAKEVSEFYTTAFFSDLDALNIPRDHYTFPRPTQYIPEQIAMIVELEKGGYTYKTSDGIYFDTSKFPEYGKLGNINLGGLEEGARIGVQSERRNPTDFALWKFNTTGKQREMEWDSPWGVGFPGWHIECSAMSKKILGETFDIHTGGMDHIPVHHNNEIAQSVCANHVPFVHYWMHNAFLTVSDGKMAKSGDNFIRLETLVEKGIGPLAYRYLLLSAKYSSPLQFSWEALEGAQTALKKIRTRMQEMQASGTGETGEASVLETYKKTFTEYINDDLNTPEAIALVWQVLRDDSLSDADKRGLILDFDRVLGLELDLVETFEIPENVQKLAQERDLARANKDFAKSDALRAEIEGLGFEVKDTPGGTTLVPR